MKIIGGQLKGRRIIAPQGQATRPSSARVKESLFNILENLSDNFFVNKTILDLFAGSGALGLEALSRGAKYVLAVEKAKVALNIIKNNALVLGVILDVLQLDATRIEALSAYAASHNLNKFDIIFADPPYGEYEVPKIFQQILDRNLVHKRSIFILEEAKKLDISFPMPFSLLKKRDYGNTTLYICSLGNYNE